MKLFSYFTSLIWVAVLGVHVGTSFAQSYPSKPIRIVVPFAPGGALDTTARLISPKMAEVLNQPVIVENHPGASGIIAENLVAKATPDGYTILLDTGLAIRPALYRKLPFDAVKDLVPVSQLLATTMVLVQSPIVQAASTKELIALAKAKPGKLNYGHSGVASPMLLVIELLKLSAGIDMLGIPYKSDGQIIIAMLSGEVDVAFVPLSSALPHIRAGRLIALGVSGAQRAAELPDVPTIAEGGVTGFEYVGWHGLFVPAGTPRNIVTSIQQAALKALNAPDIRDRFRALSQEPVGNTPEEFDAKYKSDIAKFAKIVREAKLPLQDF